MWKQASSKNLYAFLVLSEQKSYEDVSIVCINILKKHSHESDFKLFTGMQMCVSPTASDKIREIQTGDHFIKVLELSRNGDTVHRNMTKNDFIDSLQEYRLPLRDLRMLVKSSDTIRTRFPSLLPRPSSKCYIFEIEHIRFLCFRRVRLAKH